MDPILDEAMNKSKLMGNKIEDYICVKLKIFLQLQ